MIKNGFWVLMLILVLGCTVRLPDPTRDFTPEEIARRLKNSTVKIMVVRRTQRATVQYASGTGFSIKGGYIATNEHVIRDMEIKHSGVEFAGSSKQYTIQRVVAVNKEYDLAIIECPQYQAVPLILGNSNKVRVGQTVYVMGSPRGLARTFSSGLVSAIRDDAFKTSNLIQFTAPVSQGSSGSPLMNSKGQVIGVVRSSLIRGQNINFASPVNILKRMINEHLR